MTHLTPDELIDVLDGALPAVRQAHLDTCDRCRREAEELASVLGQLRIVEPSEPSPWFFDAFAARVRAAVDAEPRRAWRWFEVPVLAPLAALALLVAALVGAVPQGATGVARVQLALSDAAASPAAPLEDRWAMVFDLVGEIDLDAAVDAGFIGRPGTADGAVPHLSSDEQLELLRLLREELRTGG